MSVVDRWHNQNGGRSADYGRGLRWMVRYRDPQGRQKAKSFRTKAEADRHDLAVRGTVAQNTYVDPKAGKITFQQYADAWLAMQTHYRPGSHRSRKQMIDLRMVPHIGQTPMNVLSRSQVQAMLNIWRRDYAPATVVATWGCLRTILKVAVQDKIIASDPSETVTAPRAPRRRDARLSHEDVAKILGTAKVEFRPFFATVAWCGLRLGEALGLDVADVDFLASTINISKQMDTEDAAGKIVPYTKTEAGQRIVPLPPQLADMLAAMLATRRRADGSLEGKHLWHTDQGRRLLRTAVDSEVRRIERHTEIQFSPVHLRHYHGASLVSAGVPITQVAKQMGHAGPHITMKVYAYAMTDDAAKGREAATDVASKSSPCEPVVNRKAAGRK